MRSTQAPCPDPDDALDLYDDEIPPDVTLTAAQAADMVAALHTALRASGCDNTLRAAERWAARYPGALAGVVRRASGQRRLLRLRGRPERLPRGRVGRAVTVTPLLPAMRRSGPVTLSRDVLDGHPAYGMLLADAATTGSRPVWISGRGLDRLQPPEHAGPVLAEVTGLGAGEALVDQWPGACFVDCDCRSTATLLLSVAALPWTKEECLGVAAEHFAFCCDVDGEDPRPLRVYAQALSAARQWRFWWD